jgi:hypothetical protein
MKKTFLPVFKACDISIHPTTPESSLYRLKEKRLKNSVNKTRIRTGKSAPPIRKNWRGAESSSDAVNIVDYGAA